MKIGLLTLPLETGYGSIMQAFALKSVLAQMGHEVTLIRRLRVKQKYPLKRILRRFIKKYIFRKWDTIIFIDKKEIEEYPIITQNTQRFIDEHLQPYSPVFLSSDEFRQVNQLGFDAIVVGSDQVWRPGCMDNIEDYFLYGVDSSIRKYSYAASLGVDMWEYSEEQTLHCKDAVQQFVSTSVRELSGVSLCQNHLDITPKFVLDPTLLFQKIFYRQYISEHDQSRDGKFCAFVLDRNAEKLSLINRLSSFLRKDYYYAANNTEDRSASLQDRIAPTVSSWLDAFDSADAIFTDSFHGCAFSIIFEKDFYVYINQGRGAGRFKSLLGLVGLEHRIVTSDTDFTQIAPIDWETVRCKLNEMRVVSMEYLKGIV